MLVKVRTKKAVFYQLFSFKFNIRLIFIWGKIDFPLKTKRIDSIFEKSTFTLKTLKTCIFLQISILFFLPISIDYDNISFLTKHSITQLQSIKEQIASVISCLILHLPIVIVYLCSIIEVVNWRPAVRMWPLPLLS